MSETKEELPRLPAATTEVLPIMDACTPCSVDLGLKVREEPSLDTSSDEITYDFHLGDSGDDEAGERNGSSAHASAQRAQEQQPSKRHRVLECAECGKRYNWKSNLTKHVRIHTGERPFKCSCCSASFARRDHLQVHERMHTGERPFKCNQCGASFAQQSSLLYHQRARSCERSFKCPHCTSTFVLRHNLKRHVLRSHREEVACERS